MNKRQAKKRRKFKDEIQKLGWLMPETWSQIRWAKEWLQGRKQGERQE